MKVTRNKGIFDLKIDLSKKDEEARLLYNKLCFILNLAIPLIDELEETTIYRQDVKKIANQLRQKLIGMCDQHQLSYINFGKVPNEDKMIDTEDVYNITSKAYDEMFEWLYTRKPHHIVSSVTAIKKLEEKQPDLLDQITTEYKPILK